MIDFRFEKVSLLFLVINVEIHAKAAHTTDIA